MELILGGAFQGKRTYAQAKFGLADAEIFVCSCEAAPDFSARCVTRLEEYVLYCVRNGLTPADGFREDAVLIARDISCGIVPVDPELRLWREETGRYLTRLAGKAAHVTRLFCGLPQTLK